MSAGDWIPWAGGERPVDPDARVHVRLRDGFDTTECCRSGILAHVYRWQHREADDDIIAYQVHP